MSRVKRGVTTHARHKKIISKVKGHYGRRKNCFRISIQSFEKALLYSYRDRKTKKRTFRRLWIQRINAASRLYGITYSDFIHGIMKSSININRKMLAEIAVHQPTIFKYLAIQAKYYNINYKDIK